MYQRTIHVELCSVDKSELVAGSPKERIENNKRFKEHIKNENFGDSNIDIDKILNVRAMQVDMQVDPALKALLFQLLESTLLSSRLQISTCTPLHRGRGSEDGTQKRAGGEGVAR